MRRLVGGVAAALAVLGATTSVAAADNDDRGGHGGSGARLTVVAEGLDQPRHLDFNERGDLYIAEAGSGGTVEEVGVFAGAAHCTGFSGAVARLERDGDLDRVITGLPSAAHCADGQQGLGPSGVLAEGRHDVVVQIGSTAIFNPNTDLTAGADRYGRVLRVREDRVRRVIADITAFEAAADPDGEDYDSNPTDVAGYKGGYVVTDAGANAVHVIDGKGRLVRTVLVPQDPCPGGPGNCFGDTDLDSVPTGITRGKGDTFYVSTLSGVVADFTVTPPDVNFRPGNAKVFALDAATGEITPLATGLFTVIDVAYDRKANVVYAVEFVTGAVWRIDAATGTRTRVDQPGDFPLPGGIAVDGRGDLYVSTFAAAPGKVGQVVKLDL